MANLFTIHECKADYIKVQKTTQELDIVVEISTVFNPNLHPATTSDFLDHAVESLGWGGCLSIGAKVECGKWRSTHTIAEDLGITIGGALKKLFYERLEKEGVNISGVGFACLDESLVRAVIGVEGRRNIFINYYPECVGAKCELVEDLKTADMEAFMEGFFQGFPATCHLDFLQGKDSHHLWECAFTSVGEAIRMLMSKNAWRIAKNNPYYAQEGIADASLI